MRKLGILLAAGLLASCSAGADLPLVNQAVTSFHHQLDAGKFDALYTGGSPELHGAATEKDWNAFLDMVHAKLGNFQSAAQTGWNDQMTTGGHFVTVVYQSKYEHGGATEQFVYKIVGGKTLLTGYHVNSDVFNVVPTAPTPGTTPPVVPVPK
jgi:hypothetical protein